MDRKVALVATPFEPPVKRAGVFYTGLPLGPAYLGAELLKRGFDVRVWDCDVDQRSAVELAQEISLWRPDIVGLSVSSPGTRFAKELIRSIRSLGGGGVNSCIQRKGDGVDLGVDYTARKSGDDTVGEGAKIGENARFAKEVIVACGGPHIGADPGSARLLDADIYFTGEADFRFADFCESMRDGSPSPTVALWQDGGGIWKDGDVSWKDCGAIDDIDALCLPARDLFDLTSYKFASLLASRGCPFSCTFCGMAGSKYRKRSVDGIDEEVRDIRGVGCQDKIHCAPHLRSIDIVDDVFTLDRDFAWEVADVLESHKVRWSASTRADLIDEELLAHMKSAGMFHLSFGVEFGGEDIRRAHGKDISDSAIRSAFSLCKREGILTRAYGILGGFSETEKTMHKTVSFIESLAPTEVMYSPLILYPATVAWNRAVEEGRVDPVAWRGYMEDSGPIPVYVPEGLDYNTIEHFIERASRRFYLQPNKIIARAGNARSIGDIVDCAKAMGAWACAPFYKEGNN